MKVFVSLQLIFLFASNLRAQTTPLVTNIHYRESTSLNGKWQTIIDPYENGYYDYRYEPHPNGYFKNYSPKDRSELIEYKFDNAHWLHVPGDWNSQSEKLELYEGTIWYKQSFDYQKKHPDNRVFIHIGAANYHSISWMNGEELGEHIGGFTPFNYEITNHLKEKENFAVLKVDNKRYKEAVPTVNTDWWNYGGITRDVTLIEVPSTFIRDYFLQLEKGSMEKISGWIQLDGKELAQKIWVEIPELKIKKEIQTDATGKGAFSIMVKNISHWSPENPKLYEVHIYSAKEKIKDQIGFRCIETKGQDILLNKKSVFLRGICLHEEVPTRQGRAYSMEDARLLLGWAKELGCNYVRLAHYPHNENMTRVADQMGLMVWSEIPVYWTIQWENKATFENAKNQLTEMITRDRNKASVVLWSMANETPLSEPRLNFLKKLIEQSRSLDNTRLITAALEVHALNPHTIMLNDPLGEYLDVLGCNEYIGWYWNKPDDCDQTTWQTVYNKPLIISEFGADALYNYHGDDQTRSTEEYQENFFRHQIVMLEKITFLRGTTPWILVDFRSPRRTMPYIQDFWNRKGLLSERGEKKKAWYVMQEYYLKKMKEMKGK